ncbi:5'(3')-deoxyribonucleotidase, cytosolic type-like [Convolutriloba macropyga]|uniref:5'(3')-deoxyribonucleotidase, cytosolic type-like n=1 Tax=Convolutriloba macropyga TaxID=536237 RepID=UPI003F51DA47
MNGQSESKKVVLIDMDGVIVDFEAGYRNAVTQTIPEVTPIPRELRKSYYANLQYAALYPNIKKKFHDISKQPGYFSGLPIMPGAKTGVEKLCQYFDVFICTSPMKRYTNCVLEKYLWVEENFGFEFTTRVILTRDKTLVHGDILIDDKPEIEGVKDPSWTRVVFDQPYNEWVDTPFRMHSWEDTDKLIEFIVALSSNSNDKL